MLYQFLTFSITGDLRTHIAAKITQKKVNGCGPTLLKLITLKMHGLANRQAVRDARAALQKLNLREHGNDVNKLNESVALNTLVITANGAEQSNDNLVTTLLQTYKHEPNNKFVGLICSIENEAEQNNTEINPDELMIQAFTCYNNLVHQKQWSKADPCDAKILALEAQVKTLAAKAKKDAEKPQIHLARKNFLNG